MAKLVIGPHVIGGSPPVETGQVIEVSGWGQTDPDSPSLVRCGPVAQLSVALIAHREIYDDEHVFIGVPAGYRPPGPVILETDYKPYNMSYSSESERFVLDADGNVTGPTEQGGYAPNSTVIRLYGAWLIAPA
ncbi:MAG: hypothetical protein LBK54_10255 [Propionibacteriaceae bacterium]|jgi:hypothetical protein|nr:hypothetical protein [Propionibacteriaceae bacterium]